MSNAKSKLDTGLVRELASILRDADLGEIEIEHEGLRVRVSKPSVAVAATVAPAAPAQAAPVAAPQAAVPSPGSMTTETAPPAGGEAAPPANAVTSPMVGTVYLSPEPGSKVFVSVGSKVKTGDTLMLVEAMKTFNPVDSPRDGTVTAILVEDSQPVEFGEALIVIE
ncbi:MAG: acetyl-CoA carboxylase biotin carboxyl carrier protein [Pseudomonadota bacterium]